MRRRMLLQQGKLPSEYQEVEYIVSAGSASFDTGVKANQTLNVELGLLLPTSSYNRNYFGLSTSPALYLQISNDGSRSNPCFGGVSTQDKALWHDANKHIYVMNKDGIYVDGTLYPYVSEVPNFSHSLSCYLLGARGYYYRTVPNTRLYYCNIDLNGSRVRTYVPCYRISDSAVGIYDTTNDTFATASGMTAGPPV